MPPERGAWRGTQGTVAVALHDVQPATFARCALIRDWLDDLGVDRATLLVIPAPNLHAFNERRPDLAAWLEERARMGDAVAQHGFAHRRAHHASPLRRLAIRAGGAAEFVGLDIDETRRNVHAGRRVLRLAGIQPRGFVAPAYAYTGPLRETVAAEYDWWAGLGRLHTAGRSATIAPALGLGTSTCLRRWLSPVVLRAGARLSGPVLRLDIRPADLEHRPTVAAVERVLRAARGRTAVTYDELAGA